MKKMWKLPESKCIEGSLCPITATELKQLTCMMHSMRYSWAKASLQFTTCSSIPGRTIWKREGKVLQWFFNYLLSLYSHMHFIQTEQNFYQFSADLLHKGFLIKSPIFLQFHPPEEKKKIYPSQMSVPFIYYASFDSISQCYWLCWHIPRVSAAPHKAVFSSRMVELTRDRLLNNTSPSLSFHAVTVLLNALGSIQLHTSCEVYPRTLDVHITLGPSHYLARKRESRSKVLQFLVTVMDRLTGERVNHVLGLRIHCIPSWVFTTFPCVKSLRSTGITESLAKL